MLFRLLIAACVAAASAAAAQAPGWLVSAVGHHVLHPARAEASIVRQDLQSVVVEKVLDGDTVIVRGWRQRVRLANVDAPEMSHGYGKPGQPFSVQSTKWLTEALQGRAGVTIRCVDEDRYQRAVCDFYRGGQHVNKELVRAGLAWANTAQARYLRDPSVADAQREARAARRGLWSEPHPIEPWHWRHQCWEGGVCAAGG